MPFNSHMRTSPYRSSGTVHDSCWQAADAAATTKKPSKCLYYSDEGILLANTS